MMFLMLIALPWSPQSAWSLGDAHAFRASSSIEVGTSLDRAAYDGASFGGQPMLAYHKGTDIGLELSFGARFKVGWLYVGATPLVFGMKQTFFANERLALAVAFALSPYEITFVGSALSVTPELVVSVRLSEKWSMDVGVGALVRPYWFTPLHDVGPLARVGFTVNRNRSAIFFGFDAGSEHVFYGAGTPPPFPYVANRGFHAGLFVGYAKR